MGFASDQGFLVLHAVRVKGLADTPVIAEATGVDPGTVEATAGALATEELLSYQDSKFLKGWKLTSTGQQRHHGDLLAEMERAACRPEVEAAYEAFVALNEPFKEICTAWQLRGDASGAPQPNDHSDAAYDAEVRRRLGALHDSVVPPLEQLAGAYVRFGRYPERLNAALERFDGGDLHAFTRPLAHSYHDVWMELHQDFLLTLDRTRSAADGH